ncbi:MAG: hypothetical protein NTW11_00890 [Candidatus Staskawiczbacteria bacterium]|nr:hypothetical protein [Candidatus Staskawiczbacteria bacterium]
MKKRDRRRKVIATPVKPARRWRWTALLVAIFIVIAAVALGRSTRHAYSVLEMQCAWSNDFQQVFDQELLLNKYPIFEIQDRYNSTLQLIYQRYGSTLAINMVTAYCRASTEVLCGNYFTNGHPTVDIIIPKLLDICKDEQRKNPSGWRERMRFVLVIGFMHELDHLAFGTIAKEGDKPEPLDQLVNEEANVWALTCENTLAPLIEKYKVQLTAGEYTYYNEWLKAGRDKNSQSWRSFIRWAYRRTR